MEVQAVAKNIRMSPRKARLVADLIKGKGVPEALAILQFSPKLAAKAIAKVVKSAAANAENNFQMTPGDLRIVGAQVDEGMKLKRVQARARGRANIIIRRHCHITIVVDEEA